MQYPYKLPPDLMHFEPTSQSVLNMQALATPTNRLALITSIAAKTFFIIPFLIFESFPDLPFRITKSAEEGHAKDLCRR